MSKVELLPDFLKSLGEISSFRRSNNKFSPVVTDRISTGIVETAKNLAVMPKRWPCIKDTDIRKVIYSDAKSGAKYSIFYSYAEKNDTVYVGDVVDGVTQRASALLGYEINSATDVTEVAGAVEVKSTYSPAFIEQMQGMKPKAASGAAKQNVSDNVSE